MPLRTAGAIVNKLTSSVRKLIKDLTGLRLGTRVSNITSGTFSNLGRFSKRIPLAGGIFAYVFKHSSKGISIVLTSVDGLFTKSGKIVNDVLSRASDIAVYSLNTASGIFENKTRKRGGGRSRRNNGRRNNGRRNNNSRRNNKSRRNNNSRRNNKSRRNNRN